MGVWCESGDVSCKGCVGVTCGEGWSCDGDSTGDSQMSESSLEGRGVMRAAWVPMVRVEGTGGAWGVGTRPAILSGGHYLDQGYDIQVESPYYSRNPN